MNHPNRSCATNPVRLVLMFFMKRAAGRSHAHGNLRRVWLRAPGFNGES